jgi:Flp pilus assembly pilin Flp
MLDRFNLLVALAVGRMTELREREDGQALVEYALILTLVAIACIVVLTALGGAVRDKLQQIVTAL